MQFAVNTQHLFRAKTDHAVTARVPPFGGTAQNLNPGGRADGGQNRFGIGFDVEHVHGAGRAMHILGTGPAHQQAADKVMLFPRLAPVKGGADLEQSQIHEPTRLIARRRLQEARQQGGSHVAHVGGNWVFQHRGIIAAPEQRGRGLVDEAVGDAFVVSQGRRRPARGLLATLHRGHHGLGHTAGHAGQGLALELGQRRDPRDFLHKVRLAHHIRAPAGHMGHIAIQSEAKGRQRLTLLGLRNVHAHKALHPRSVELVSAGCVRGGTSLDTAGHLATGNVHDHLAGEVEANGREHWINAALKPVTRVRIDAQGAPGIGGADRIEIGGLDKDIHRVCGATALQAAHDATDAFHAVGVRDQGHVRGEGVFLFIQTDEGLSALSPMHAQGAARDFVGIKDVEGAVAVKGEIICHIHQERDGAQTDGAQTILEPLRAWAVGHATDHAAKEDGALIQRVGVDGHGNWARECAFKRRLGRGFERAHTTRGQIAGNAAHAQRVGPVGRDRDLDHRINLGRIIFGQPIDKAVAHLARRQFDDTVMLFAEFHLAFGGHHAKAFDAPDFAHADGGVDARDVNAGLGDDDRDSFAGVRGTTDDLFHALIRIDLTNAQTVRVGVLFRADHLADGKIRQLGTPIFDAFDLKAEVRQGVADVIHRGDGIEVLSQPGKREFHAIRSLRARSPCNGKDQAKVQGRAGVPLGTPYGFFTPVALKPVRRMCRPPPVRDS
mmetsp:Transcript_18332/g.29379  ORF Transcript_18332/g.29379 Transcript_18332/m.29379 type:complete len:721 (+) Transcript_18332:509-2671(+)